MPVTVRPTRAVGGAFRGVCRWRRRRQRRTHAVAQFSGWTDSRFEKAHQKHQRPPRPATGNRLSPAASWPVLFGDGTYYKKPIDLDVGTIYAPLVEHARAELMTRLANQTEATWRLLKHFDEAYTALSYNGAVCALTT